MPFIQVEMAIVGLLLLAIFVGLLTKRLRVPYTVGLVLFGLALTLLTDIEVNLGGEIILAVLVPPLVFEAAFHIKFDQLRRELGLVMLLAVPGVLLTTWMVGWLLSVSLSGTLTLPIALVFGALVSATDPVAVVALFRALGAPKRLQILLEGESLFNDGTAIVVFHLVLGQVLQAHGDEFLLGPAIVEFTKVAGGGLFVGLALGLVASLLIARVDDHLIETTLTTVLAYGAYLVAEEFFHVSGVLAVVMAGMIAGNIGPRGMTPTTRISLLNFWEYAAFLANTFVFLLIGLQVDLGLVWQYRWAVLQAIAAVLVTRFVIVFGLSLVFRRALPPRWAVVLFWGGLRGAISLALALGLPTELGAQARGLLQALAFGVVLFTLLVQGLTIEPLIHRLGLIGGAAEEREFQRLRARLRAAQAALERIQTLHRQGVLTDATYRNIEPILRQRQQRLQQAIAELLREHPLLGLEEMRLAQQEAFHAQRAALHDLLIAGGLSEEVYHDLVAELDQAVVDAAVPPWPGWALRRSPDEPPITALTAAVIHQDDLGRAMAALEGLGVPAVDLPAEGGFLSQRRVVLLLPVPEGDLSRIIETLNAACRRRVDWALQAWHPRLPIPVPRRVVVGGLNAFVLPVERFEEL
ncbi:MAG: Na+/H+ antiporter [Chloroflexi bacterium]|nr:Na+/H+ antiporter [Chloroflexota bacterium]